MKILHIATEKSWRGGENQLRLLLAGLRAKGVENHLVVQPESAAAKIFAENDHARTYSVKMRNDLDVLAALKIAKICRHAAIDIIHAHTARAHAIGLITKAILRTRGGPTPQLVVHRRVEQPSQISWLERLKYQNPDINQYICVSKAVAAGMSRIGVDGQRIEVVYSAVDPEPHRDHAKAREEARNEFKFRNSDTIVCCVAAVEAAKGIEYLMSGWYDFKASCPSTDAKLLIVGDGQLRETLEKELQNSPLKDSVLFTGFRRDVARIMAASDILILPTLWEGLGTVLLDGLLAGCAVIGSDVGGVSEIIRDHQTGLLIPAKDSTAISQSIRLLATDIELRKNLVYQGQQHVAKYFSLEAMVNGNFNVYQKILMRR